LARDHGLIEDGEKATAIHIKNSSISVEFGSIAIGLPCPDPSTSAISRSRPAKIASRRARTDLMLLGAN